MSSPKIANPSQVRTWCQTEGQFEGQAFLSATQGRIPKAAGEAFNKAHKGKYVYAPAVKAPKTVLVPVTSANVKGVVSTRKRTFTNTEVRAAAISLGYGKRGRLTPEALVKIGETLSAPQSATVASEAPSVTA